MKRMRILLAAFIAVLLLSLSVAQLAAQSAMGPVAPDAGQWPTWILESGNDVSVDPPPDDAATAAEITQLVAMMADRDEAALEQIAYWDSGPPAYRWNQITLDAIVKRGIPIHFAERALSLVHVGIYDGTIAGWNAKYEYNRLRPSEFDSALMTVIPNPSSPGLSLRTCYCRWCCINDLELVIPK